MNIKCFKWLFHNLSKLSCSFSLFTDCSECFRWTSIFEWHFIWGMSLFWNHTYLFSSASRVLSHSYMVAGLTPISFFFLILKVPTSNFPSCDIFSSCNSKFQEEFWNAIICFSNLIEKIVKNSLHLHWASRRLSILWGKEYSWLGESRKVTAEQLKICEWLQSEEGAMHMLNFDNR